MYNRIYLLLKEEYFVILIKKFWNLQKNDPYQFPKYYNKL